MDPIIREIGQTGLILLKGDITSQKVDIIVNAANERLVGGGGVDGAIHSAGGPSIMQECNQIRKKQGGCPTGQAVYTTAGNLQAKYVIHTVGPVWHGGSNDEEILLKSCYWNCLKLAHQLKAQTIAFPSISTGVYRFPLPFASKISLETIIKEIPKYIFGKIVFVLFSDEIFLEFKKSLDELLH